MPKEAYLYGKRGLCVCQKRPTCMAKEAYLYGKRGLFVWQKRPIEIIIPEVCVSVKRDLWIGQKRPLDRAKETYG